MWYFLLWNQDSLRRLYIFQRLGSQAKIALH